MNMKSKLIPASIFLLTSLLSASGASFAAPKTQVQALNAQAPSGASAGSQTDSASTPDIDPTSYVLAPYDQLDIDLQDQPTMRRTVTILQDGTFNYPVVGAVKASGMTVAELQTQIDSGLSERYNEPHVIVTVLQTHMRKISVTGAVRAPGEYDYRPGLRLLELIAACGGPTSTPELTQATLISDHGGKSTPINLEKLINEGDQTQNLLLQPGDSLLFSPKDPATSTIHIVGQVLKPGDYSVVASGATVLALLTEAGGATADAALSQTQILRHDSGDVQTVDLHPLKFDLNDPAGKIKLEAGDTLLVPENNNKIYILGEVRSNSVFRIPDGETLTLTEALAEAGGPNDDGDKKQVGIIRHVTTKTGTERKLIEVNVADLLKNQGDAQDVPLQPGDEVIVPTRHHGHSVWDYIGGVSQAAYTAVGLHDL
jgi:polysaccharide export outer membrane protein